MKIFFLAIILFFSLSLFAQYQTTASGGTANGSGGTATSTIGLPLYTNQNNTGVTILQGNQQPREFLTVSYQSHVNYVGIKVFPNPAETFFYIQVDTKKKSNLSYKLTTLDGKLILENKLYEPLTMVNIIDYAVGIYFLQLFSDNELLSSTKIIKTNF